MQSFFHTSTRLVALAGLLILWSCQSGLNHQIIGSSHQQYGLVPIEIDLQQQFANPYDQAEVMLDVLISEPDGQQLVLPAFFDPLDIKSPWKARFTPMKAGLHQIAFRLTTGETVQDFSGGELVVSESSGDGFLRLGDYWSLRFDSGKPFRGIGENVGWEARAWEDPKYTYDYLLPTLAENGANFFRTWMCAWNLPVSWPQVQGTDRYSNSGEYFNPEGIRRMDELMALCDSLDLYLMLAMDYHGALIPGGGWQHNRYNRANGGPADSPADFFANEEARKMAKNKFRYLIARWGYSTHLAMWEFFNEIDNAVFTPTPHDSTLIPHALVTDWHREMSAYIKATDPYGHIVTTSVSHRKIDGLFELQDIDIVQEHIYKKTHLIPGLIYQHVKKYEKPFIWGEFGYEWDWNLDFEPIARESDYDYRRGLWYGLFSPTPVLPMTWWWEFFDERNMTPYFQAVRQINDQMLAIDSPITPVPSQAAQFQALAVNVGDTYFVVALNHADQPNTDQLTLEIAPGRYQLQQFDPDTRQYADLEAQQTESGTLRLSAALDGMDELVFVLKRIEP